jgi:hypothetical protein
MQEPTYDVAISFLSQDEPLAAELYSELRKNLLVFFSPKNQEQLAGTDGLVTFRQAFLSQSRLVVILYRSGWGETPWTGVEELAIKERLLLGKGGRNWLLLVNLDSSPCPLWVPKHAIWLDYNKYSKDLAGAIKLRVQELGGELTVETAVDKARRMTAIAAAEVERENKLSLQGRDAVLSESAKLYDLVERMIKQIAQEGPQFGLEHCRDESGIALRTALVSMKFGVPQNHSNYPPLRHLMLGIYSGRIFMRHEFETGRVYIPGREPPMSSEQKFQFDYNAAYGWCWRGANGDLLTTESLSEFLMKTLLEEHGKADAGDKTPRRISHRRISRTPWS